MSDSSTTTMSAAEARALLAESKDRHKVIDAQTKVLAEERVALHEVSTEAINAIIDSGEYTPEEFLGWATGSSKANDILAADVKAASPFIYARETYMATGSYGTPLTDEQGKEKYAVSLGFNVMLAKHMSDEQCDDLAAAIRGLIAKYQPIATASNARDTPVWYISLFGIDPHDPDEPVRPIRNPLIETYSDGGATLFDQRWRDIDDVEVVFETLADAFKHCRKDYWYDGADRYVESRTEGRA